MRSLENDEDHVRVMKRTKITKRRMMIVNRMKMITSVSKWPRAT